MHPKWILEDIFQDNQISLMEKEITKQGLEVKVIKENNISLDPSVWSELFDEEDCVIFYGSQLSCRNIRNHTKYIPGAFFNIENYSCNSYYPKLNKYLLNNDYIIIPYGDLQNKKDFLFSIFGDIIFIRPVSGWKIFSGHTISINDWDQKIKDLEYYLIPSNTLVLISSYKCIQEEYRLIVNEEEVVYGGTYSDQCDQFSDDIIKFGQRVLQEIQYKPDFIWTMDICLTEKLHVVEINSFSSSGIYTSNFEKIIKVASEAALKEWNFYHSEDF